MAGKLSNGTLGLRFMQNAMRAKQATVAEAEQAKVKDEAEWEVSPAVRASWGLDANAQAEESNIYENSYLPFLYPSLASASSSSSADVKPKGRRKFDKKGQEREEHPPDEVSEDTELTNQAPSSSDWSKGRTRPVSISGSRSVMVEDKRTPPSKSFTHKAPQSSPIALSARASIFANAEVGSDLRRMPSKAKRHAVSSDLDNSAPPTMSSSTGFMKPAGIDSPATERPKSRKRDRGPDVISSVSGPISEPVKRKRRE